MTKDMSWYPRYINFVNQTLLHGPEIMSIAKASWSHIDLDNAEPTIIRDYMSHRSHGLSYLNNYFPHEFKDQGYEVKFAGIFVHQKPIITRLTDAPNDKCELGDLLLIFTYLNANKRSLLNRAMLCQAKKGFSISNRCQQELYDNDLEFYMPRDICDASKCSCDSSRFFPQFYYRKRLALKYLICDNQNHDKRITMMQIPSAAHIISDWEFSILGLLTGLDGLHFTAVPRPGNQWSAIVWDLINIVASSTIGKSSLPRGNNLRHLVNCFNDFKEVANSYLSANNGSGIPICLIIIRDVKV